jgi:hypothetical protein
MPACRERVVPLDLTPDVGASPDISGAPTPIVPGPAVGAPVRARDDTPSLEGKPVACPTDGGIDVLDGNSRPGDTLARMGRAAALRQEGVRGDDGLRFQGDAP